MAVPAEENTKQELEQTPDEELDENEAQKSLDDFLRDTNELVGGTTEDNVRSPASSDDTESEFHYLYILSRDVNCLVRFNWVVIQLHRVNTFCSRDIYTSI